MTRFLIACCLLLAGLSGPARAADGVPTKPDPFTFVTDQAHLLSAADAQKLSDGLSSYAASTGTPVIVVTVPSLGGQSVSELARQIGNTWQVGQTDKNNGIVVLLSGQEHQLSIQAGAGMQSRITPAVVQQVIRLMTPDFKQNNYFAGLHKGLNLLLLTANPNSDPRKSKVTVSTAPAATEAANSPTAQNMTPAPEPAAAPAEPVSQGLPWGTMLLGLVVVVGGIMLLRKVFGNRNPASSQGAFMGSGNAGPGGNTPNFGAPNAGYQQGGYGNNASSGPGIGGMLATGAAAAAGAYLGERLGSNHDSDRDTTRNFDNGNTNSGAAGTSAASDYFSGASTADSNSGPDYFSNNNSSDSSSSDYFSDDNSSSSSNDTSGDFGGGDFSSSDSNSGSW